MESLVIGAIASLGAGLATGGFFRDRQPIEW